MFWWKIFPGKKFLNWFLTIVHANIFPEKNKICLKKLQHRFLLQCRYQQVNAGFEIPQINDLNG